MRGEARTQGQLTWTQPEHVVPADHPLRRIKADADAALRRLEPQLARLYSTIGRPSIPPEALLKATLLIALYTVRSERLFCEQLAYNWLFRWFVDLDNSMDTWDASTFSKNRARLLEADLAGAFLAAVVALATERGLLSDEHFTVDGTLIDAWASLKSVQPRDPDGPRGPVDPGNRGRDFHGERRSNTTHQSRTDPEARLCCKGTRKEAHLGFLGHALIASGPGLCLQFRVTRFDGYAEVDTALDLLDAHGVSPGTVAADKGYDVPVFRDGCCERGYLAHVAHNRTTLRRGEAPPEHLETPAYHYSQRVRKKVEEVFSWIKTIGGLRKTRYRGIARTNFYAQMAATAYNLRRLAKLTPVAA